MNRQINMTESRMLRHQVIGGVLVIVLAAVLVYGLILYGRPRLGIEQPIPFSHRMHANDKKISCFFCHPERTT